MHLVCGSGTQNDNVPSACVNHQLFTSHTDWQVDADVACSENSPLGAAGGLGPEL